MEVFSLKDGDCLAQPIQMQLSPEYIWNFEFFQKKDELQRLFFFWNWRPQKARLLKCLKRPVSEHLWRVNMLKGPKHWLNFHSSFFVNFF